jgi:hypothetical protein
MRMTYLLITLSSAMTLSAFAQMPTVKTNNLTPPGDSRPQQTLPKLADSDVEFQTSPFATPKTGQDSKVILEGALVRATQAGQPWQVINPFAPKEFGDGYGNVSIHPTTGQPAGCILLSVRFGKFGRNHK